MDDQKVEQLNNNEQTEKEVQEVQDNQDKVNLQETPRYQPTDAFQATVAKLRELLEDFNYYKNLQTSFAEGSTNVELRKKFMLKVIDERWVRAIEDTIPAIDVIIRNPNGNLEEFSEVKPIELTRKVTTESVIYLSQHTDDINEIYDDGSVMPARLLNVYHDETLFTYENKFINTLINRLAAFVMLRYDAAVACGEDEKQTCFTYEQTFEQNVGELTRTGKINVSIQISEPPSKEDQVKNYIYATDLWRRVERIVDYVKNFMLTPFVREMGKNYIRPPVMRTNKLLKNVNFNQCLQLWEFIEQYESTGYETLISESLEDVDQEFLKDFNNSVAAQYTLFQKNVCNDFVDEKSLDSRMSNVFTPKIKNELEEFNEEDYALKNKEKKNEGVEIADDIDLAVQIALAHDELNWREVVEEVEEEETSRTNYSYLGRYVQAGEATQDFYTIIRNKILSYRDVESETNWKQEVFSQGKNKLVKLVMRGKTLNFSIALNPDDYVGTKYKYVNQLIKKPKEKFPMLLKIRNQKMCKQAVDLIVDLMKKKGIKKIGLFKPIDYHVAYIPVETMLTMDPPLAREMGSDLNIRKLKMDIMDLINRPEQKEAEARFDYSYLGRLVRAQDPCQNFYTQIRNKLLSYNDVESIIGWKQEVYSFGKDKVVKMVMRGKTINMSLALDPKPYIDKEYKVVDAREKKPKEKMPAVIKVKNQKTLKQALEMIQDLINKYNLEAVSEFEEINYHIRDISYDEMIALDPPLAREIGKSDINIRTLIMDIYPLLEMFPPLEETPEELEDDEIVNQDVEGIDEEEEEDEDADLINEILEEKDEISDEADINDEEETGEDITLVDDESELEEIEEEDEDEEEIVTISDEPNAPRYNISYLGRLVQAGQPTQTFYSQLRNKMLSYRDVESTINWKQELFTLEKEKLVKMVIRGKSINFQIALDPQDYVDSKIKFKNLLEKKPKEKLPLLMKVRNQKTCKQASDLITDLMKKNSIRKIGLFKDTDYTLPEISLEDMLTMNPPLALEKGVPSDLNMRTLKMDILSLITLPEAKPYEPRYDYSYLGRIVRAQQPCQKFYTEIRNALLSYDNVTSEIGWKQEFYSLKKDKIVKMVMRGKTINMYINIDPRAYIKKEYKVEDLRDKKKKVKFPTLIKIKNLKTMNQALEIIADLMKKNNATQNPEALNVNYYIRDISYEEMVALNPPLAREVGKTEVNVRTVKLDIYAILEMFPFIESDSNDSLENLENLENLEIEEEDLEPEEDEDNLEDSEENSEENSEELEGQTEEEQDAEQAETQELEENSEPENQETEQEETPEETSEEEDEEEDDNDDDDDSDEEFTLEEIAPVPQVPEEKALETEDSEEENQETSNEEAIDSTPVEPEYVDVEVMVNKYTLSFQGRLILLQEPIQSYYTEIKNEFLKYDSVVDRMSFRHETYKSGRLKLAKISVRGKSIRVFLSLDPSEFDEARFKFVDMRIKKPNAEYPMMMKISSPRKLRRVLELINELMNRNSILAKENPEVIDYHRPSMTLEEMINSDEALVKVRQVPVIKKVLKEQL